MSVCLWGPGRPAWGKGRFGEEVATVDSQRMGWGDRIVSLAC